MLIIMFNLFFNKQKTKSKKKKKFLNMDFVCQIEHIHIYIQSNVRVNMKLVICQFIFCFFISMSVICKLHFERIDRRINLFEAVERVYLSECVLFGLK